MAHDKQHKESTPIFGSNVTVKRFDYPKKGEKFWNKLTHRLQIADRDMGIKYLILGDD